MRTSLLPRGQAALAIAHPGHELRVYHWVERAAPRVFVLTDGSGRTGRSRLPSTNTVLQTAGATPGSVYGRLTDAALYAALLRHDLDLFIGIADELARDFLDHEIAYVAGDPLDGYNPGHDVCRLLIDAAAATVRNRGRRIRLYDFPLVGRPDDCPETAARRSLWLRLDPEAFERKRQAAESYVELAGELAGALRENGAEAFRTECLRPVLIRGTRPGQPYYERYGEKQVRAGHYDEVVCYRKHVLPLAAALRQRAPRGIRCAALRS